MDETQSGIHNQQGKNNKKTWIIAAVVLVVVLVVAGFFIFKAATRTDSSQLTRNLLLEESNSVNFPVYYPKSLPEGFTIDEESINIQEEALFLSYKYGEKDNLIVTQQARPPIMEDVKQTEKVNTPIGKGYIADLNGNITGFIVADQTLIIISNADNAGRNNSPILKQLMGTFVLLK